MSNNNKGFIVVDEYREDFDFFASLGEAEKYAKKGVEERGAGTEYYIFECKKLGTVCIPDPTPVTFWEDDNN